MPVIRASLLAVFALIGLALALDLARAQDPTTETGTTLHPGLNLIGWTAEPTPTSQLFREIPQLEAIWAWDAELDDWIVAARGAPEWLGGLGRITPGMGLRMQLSGDQPFNWQRSTEPTRGLVKLRTGWNLVAWSGADQTPIDDALKGIGWSLRNVHRWNPTTQQWSAWTSPERTAQLIAADNADQETDDDSETPTIRRGEALWINVARAVNWLQPTDILPRLVFPGGASQQLQTRVREDLEATLAFYRDQHSIQADFANTTIYVAKNAEALIQAQKDDGYEIDDAGAAFIRETWDRTGAWVDREIVLKQAMWPENQSTSDISWARYTLTHEYFHILQIQIADGWPGWWLTEGTATWAEGEHLAIDGSWPREDAYDERVSSITEDTPILRSTESPNKGWGYALGWLAIDRLTTTAGDGSYIEFWRQLASTEIGPHGRWTSTPNWRIAFQETFDVPVSSFYADFNAWQQEQAAANGVSASSSQGDARWIRGRVTDESGAPVAGVFMNAIQVEGSTRIGVQNRAETNVDGAFAVRAAEDGDYRISVDITDDCTRYYNNGDLAEKPHGAQPLTVAGQDLQSVNVQLRSNVCGWQIRGWAIDAAGEPLAGISAGACLIASGVDHCSWLTSTTLDGSFAVSAPSAGAYYLGVQPIDDCTVYYRSSGESTLNRDQATLIRIEDNDVSGFRLQVPSDLCRLRVVGNIEGIERFLDIDDSVDVHLHSSGPRSKFASRTLERGGSFAVVVPTVGSYELSYLLDGCRLYHSPTGLTGNRADAMRFDAGDRDVRIGHRQVPDTMCAYQISGTIVDADGAPLAATSVGACEPVNGGRASCGSDWTDGDGAFAITVPVDGTYRLSFNLDGCTVHFGQGRLTSDRDEAQLFRVDGRDVELSQRQVPEGMCADQMITGSITQADGQPLVGTYIAICLETGLPCQRSWGAATDSDGAFAITAPGDGVYFVRFEIDGCTIYFRSGGFTTTWSERGSVTIAGRSVQLNPRRIPGSMCTATFQGVVLDSKGNPVRGAEVRAAGSVGQTGADGKFAFSLVEHGEHVITVSLAGQPGNGESCHVRIGDGRIVWRQENAVPIDTADVRNNPIRIVIPESACERRIRGVLTDASGAALAGAWVFQGEGADYTYTRTAQDGSFSLYIPLPGDYRVRFDIPFDHVDHVDHGGCRVWARGTSTVSTAAAAGVIKVGSTYDPAPLVVRLTERSC